jgi:hypothetical protein
LSQHASLLCYNRKVGMQDIYRTIVINFIVILCM